MNTYSPQRCGSEKKAMKLFIQFSLYGRLKAMGCHYSAAIPLNGK